MPKIYSDLAIPPHELLEEIMLDESILLWSERFDCGPQTLEAFIKNKYPITPKIAKTFAKHTDVAAHIWTGLEEKYRETLRRNKEQGHE